jgi:hypothetical protein
MNDPQQSGDLADLISRLWHGQRSAKDRAVHDTARAACQETPNPLANDFKHPSQEQIGHKGLYPSVPTDKGTQGC